MGTYNSTYTYSTSHVLRQDVKQVNYITVGGGGGGARPNVGLVDLLIMVKILD